MRERGLADTRRSPEDERGYVSGLNHLPEYRALTDQMFLADELREGVGAHPLRQRHGRHGEEVRHILFNIMAIVLETHIQHILSKHTNKF